MLYYGAVPSNICRRAGDRNATSTSQLKKKDKSSLSRCVLCACVCVCVCVRVCVNCCVFLPVVPHHMHQSNWSRGRLYTRATSTAHSIWKGRLACEVCGGGGCLCCAGAYLMLVVMASIRVSNSPCMFSLLACLLLRCMLHAPPSLPAWLPTQGAGPGSPPLHRLA